MYIPSYLVAYTAASLSMPPPPFPLPSILSLCEEAGQGGAAVRQPRTSLAYLNKFPAAIVIGVVYILLES